MNLGNVLATRTRASLARKVSFCHRAIRLKKLLEERIAFAIEGFRRRGGVQLNRRDVLEMYKSEAPESQRELMPLILQELHGEYKKG